MPVLDRFQSKLPPGYRPAHGSHHLKPQGSVDALETTPKDDSSLVQLFIMLHRPVNFEISAVACTSQQANLKKQWSMKYYKQLNGKAIIFKNSNIHIPI